MRTRRANRSKRVRYTTKYNLGSDESGEDAEATQAPGADEDNEFNEPEGPEGAKSASDQEGDEVGAGNGEAAEDDVPSDGTDEDGAQDDDDDELMDVDSDEEEDKDEQLQRARQTRNKWKRKLPRRSAVHTVPSYPAESRNSRVYDGPAKRNLRGMNLVTTLYGLDEGHVKVVRGMLNKWFDHQALPNRGPGEGGVMQSPWLAEDYEEKQRHWCGSWYAKYRGPKGELQRLRKIRPDHVDMFKPPMSGLVALVGPFHCQKQIRTQYGFAHPVSEGGELWRAADPAQEEATPPKGWLLDTGGIPLAVGWAPLIGHKEQFLAVCTIPFADQDPKDADSPEDDPEEKKKGSVQVWSIPCHREDGSDGRLVHSFSFDWGRPKRLQWCPVPPPHDSKIGLLAVLCADGQVRVIEVPRPIPGQENYEWVTSPVATLGISDEYAVRATCLTWVNINRLCLGHADGSISLWSIYPQQLLTRRAAHISQILDIASGFPSHPYHIATVPVGGCPTLTDLILPSAETTYVPLPSCTNFQPNLLDWNDHLQGYFGLHPSPAPHNTVVGFTHVRHFVQSRTLMTAPSPPMCVAGGRTHPFALVGCADGSLWAFNPLRVLIKERGDELHKLKVLQHEFRPPPESPSAAVPQDIRGAARILQGFRPEFNSNPRPGLLKELDKRRAAGRQGKKPKGKSHRKKAPGQEEVNPKKGEHGLKVQEEEELARETDRPKVFVHEAQTRITVAAWNPNVEYGWWAAAAMGSGLVKVMDLGLDGWSHEKGFVVSASDAL